MPCPSEPPLYVRVLEALPATAPELAAIFERTTKQMNAMLYWLSLKGKCRRTDREGMWMGPRGRYPHLWERT